MRYEIFTIGRCVCAHIITRVCCGGGVNLRAFLPNEASQRKTRGDVQLSGVTHTQIASRDLLKKSHV